MGLGGLFSRGDIKVPTIGEVSSFLDLVDDMGEEEQAVSRLEFALVDDIPNDWRGRLAKGLFAEASIQEAADEEGIVATPYVKVDAVVDGEHVLSTHRPSSGEWKDLEGLFYGGAPRSYPPFAQLAGRDVSMYSVSLEILCEVTFGGGEVLATDWIDAGFVQIV